MDIIALGLDSGLLDCDAEIERGRRWHAENFPQYVAEANDYEIQQRALLDQRTMLGIELGLYDQQGILLGPRTPRRCKEVSASLCVSVDGRAIIERDVMAARMYPNKRHLRAVVSEKQGWHVSAVCWLGRNTRTLVDVAITWKFAWPEAQASFTSRFAIMPPSVCAALVVQQISPFVRLSEDGYNGEWYDAKPRAQTYGVSSLRRGYDALVSSGGITVDMSALPG